MRHAFASKKPQDSLKKAKLIVGVDGQPSMIASPMLDCQSARSRLIET